MAPMAENAITLHGHRFYMEESAEDRRVRLAEEYEVIRATAPAVEWQPQTDSPLEVLRPAWDLWTLAYDLWTVWFLGLARYTSQKSGMLHHVQDRHDAGLTPWWWS
jgi:hypothetical protein